MICGRCRILENWDKWDISIHCDQAQIDRQGRATTYHFDFIIDYDNKSARFSSTSDLPYYDTSLYQCTCYDFQNRNLPCKHMYRLAAELGIVEIINRNSSETLRERLDELKDSNDIDSNPEQLKRMERAKDRKCAPVSVDIEKQSAVFSGSGKTPYITTLDSCTCRDYFIRRLPCKHIYRLRIELASLGNST